MVSDLTELRALADRLRSSGRFSLRVLPDGPSAMRAQIVGLSFSTSPRQARYVPLAVRTGGGGLFDAGDADAAGRSVDLRAALDVLKPLLEDESLAKVGHDLKFDAIVLARHGVTLRGLETDTMIASYLLDATRSSHPLEDLAIEHVGYKALTEEDVCGRGAKAISFATIPVESALDYAGERSDLSLQLSGKLRGLLQQEQLESPLRGVRAPAHSRTGGDRARRGPCRHGCPRTAGYARRSRAQSSGRARVRADR